MNENERGYDICVLGLGYIGLPSASILATQGYNVLGVDVRKDIVDKLNRGQIHIKEPGLATLVEAAVKSGRLKSSLKPDFAEVFIIAVPTPITKKHKSDMSFVEMATKSIVPYLKQGNLVILESTSPPRTCIDMICPILEESGLKSGDDFFVAHSPERVLPGQILKELISNDRIIGGITTESAHKAEKIYRSFVQGEIFITDSTTAEMSKLAENTFRDVNIALANELARICNTLHISIWDVIQMANRHPRVNIHTPGPGVGGHCIAVDPWFIVESDPVNAKLIKTAREVNDSQPEHVIRMIENIIKRHGEGKIAFLGVTYKANVDDIRESPSFTIIRHFMKKKSDILVFDPNVQIEEFPLASDYHEVLSKAKYMVFLVDHDLFKTQMEDVQDKIIIDLKNVTSNFTFPKKNKVYLLGVGK